MLFDMLVGVLVDMLLVFGCGGLRSARARACAHRQLNDDFLFFFGVMA
jgi:hypothetical protein